MKLKRKLPPGTYCSVEEIRVGRPAVFFLPSGKTIRTAPVVKAFIAVERFAIETEKRIYAK